MSSLPELDKRIYEENIFDIDRKVIEANVTSEKISKRFNISNGSNKDSIESKNAKLNSYISNYSKSKSGKSSNIKVGFVNNNNPFNKSVDPNKLGVVNPKNTNKAGNNAAKAVKKSAEGTKKAASSAKDVAMDTNVATKAVDTGAKAVNLPAKKLKSSAKHLQLNSDNLNGNSSFLTNKLTKRIPFFDKLSSLSQNQTAPKDDFDDGSSLVEKLKTKIIKLAAVFFVLLLLLYSIIIITIIGVVIILVCFTPLGQYMGLFNSPEMTSNPNYIVNVLEEKNELFNGDATYFMNQNEYNEVINDSKNCANNYYDIVSTYLSIMCAKIYSSDSNNIADAVDEMLIVDTDEEKKLLSTLFEQYNYTSVNDARKTVIYFEDEVHETSSIYASNVIFTKPFSTSGGKDLNKVYLYNLDTERYLKNIFGQYITADSMEANDLKCSIKNAYQLVKYANDTYGYSSIYQVNHIQKDVISVEKTKEVDYQIMTVYRIDKKEWINRYGSNYDDLVIYFMNMMEDIPIGSTAGFNGDVSSYNIDQAALSDSDFASMMNVALPCMDVVTYTWGGGPSNYPRMDCSGFVSYVLINSGLRPDIGYLTTDPLLGVCSTFTNSDQAKPGDLIWFASTDGGKGGQKTSHVGIVVGNGNMIHCSSSKRTVVISSYETSYWKEHFYCYGRVNK